MANPKTEDDKKWLEWRKQEQDRLYAALSELTLQPRVCNISGEAVVDCEVHEGDCQFEETAKPQDALLMEFVLVVDYMKPDGDRITRQLFMNGMSRSHMIGLHQIALDDI